MKPYRLSALDSDVRLQVVGELILERASGFESAVIFEMRKGECSQKVRLDLGASRTPR